MSDVLEQQRQYYAARAPEYDDWWWRRGPYALEPAVQAQWDADVAEADRVLEAFGPSGSVLELAAGTGIWTRKLIRLADRVVALDANVETLALNTPEAELVHADVFAWRPEGRFDLVSFSFWLSHVPEERFDAFWGLVRSALKPGGRVFLVDSAVTPGRGDSGIERRRLYDGREFTIVKRYWQPGELAARVRPLGFELDLTVTAHGHFFIGAGSVVGEADDARRETPDACGVQRGGA